MNSATDRKIIWLTWERQVRNRSLSSALGIPLFELLSAHGRMARYLICIRITVEILCRLRPSVVVCQNPSLVLTTLLLGLRQFFAFRLVIDAHFGGVEAYNRSQTLQNVLDQCNQAAELVIVTNEAHAQYVHSLGGKTFLCPDPLPDLSRYYGQTEEVPGKVFFICSFDIDEPFREVFRAAEILDPQGLNFYVSGNYRKAGIEPGDFPNVKFLGYVPEREFYRHLFSSQVVVDLTDHENCLVCGAYEAIEACKPLVLSKKKSLQKYFTGGTVFTRNDASDIARAVRTAHVKRCLLAEESRQWAMKTRAEMKRCLTSLRIVLESL